MRQMVQQLAEDLKAWQVLAALFGSVILGAVAIASTYARAIDRVDKVDGIELSIQRIDRNMARMATKLDVALENPK